MDNRVVITGLGITSSLGHSLDEVSSALAQGQSNIQLQEDNKQFGFQSLLQAMIPPQNKYKIERRKKRFLSESAIYTALCWLKTVDENNLDPQQFTGPDVGIILGNDSSAQPLEDLVATLQKYKETHFLGSTMVIKVMNSCCSMNLGPLIGAQGINITASANDASGAHALGYAFNLVKSGKQQAIITGGFQELHWIAMASFDALGIFAQSLEPKTACRPFDGERIGTVPGGGGALLVMENLERAQRLGHKIYGEVIGYGFNSGDKSVAQYERCMRKALHNAKIDPNDIDYINANASGIAADNLEAQAIYNVFGPQTFVSSTKSITGHELWMSGASEVLYSLLMMRDGFIAPSLNFQQNNDIPHINIVTETLQRKPRTVLSNTFGLGGTNACIIIREY
ncbi:beta-ketoacyl-[acyl-carrier-protein] synthase family protein [Candidatus Uabimicrobium amorphum]|uniref:3-oxoacyl-[acyl-carrier-protein] synthase 1 n=1 Tax=Uabimicrobium amorphum TaxID=2596890 RepID=A0A5S9ILW4_UABAM|nr:beta-ketoacyl-[acyl-carrier-protein] synthase family protein [Candidatus Uabimicrobium amorphum]BBM84298.1 beta-ketoacyl synthase [Candidatus Uabimicrobium amorphum]